MEEGEEPASVNFVPCLKWIRRGIAKQNPVKIELTKQELTELVKNTTKQLKVSNNEADSDDEEEVEEPKNEGDEYDLENYDNDTESQLNVKDIAIYEDDDPYNIDEDDEDSDAEDDYINPDDNLIVVGHVEGFSSSLEVYVHNQFEGSFYVHHDLLLPSVPLCIEWLNYDPKNVDRAANLCAVGSMAPVIDVWDIDLVNSIEPCYKLGRKGSRKKGIAHVGHKDAVLDISWNSNLTHILASGSADNTVLLWDLERKQPHTTISSFDEKIQTLSWHPVESHLLLTGSCDKYAKLFDCHSPDSFKSWTLEGEVERVIWNHFNSMQFICSDNKGYIYCFDYRQNDPIWKLLAHTKEITGLTLSSSCPNFLATASQDGTCKMWDIAGAEPELICDKNLKIGDIQCLEAAPDDPFLLASGGTKRSKNFNVFSASINPAVQARFRSRELVPERPIEGMQPSTSEVSRVHPVVKKTKKINQNSLKVIKKKKGFKKRK